MEAGETIALIKALGNGGGSSLPAVTSADNGKVLAVKDGAWAADEMQQKKFIVTLTPTSPDFSGTMDKTVAEITAAYEAGQEIWACMSSFEVGFYTPLSMVAKTSNPYPAFFWNAFMSDNNALVQVIVTSTVDGTIQTYSTTIYSLTPAS